MMLPQAEVVVKCSLWLSPQLNSLKSRETNLSVQASTCNLDAGGTEMGGFLKLTGQLA